MTESWIKTGDHSVFSELVPPEYDFFNTPRLTGRGGGLVTIFKNRVQCCLLSTTTFTSFELQEIHLNSPYPVLLLLIYRPPSSSNFINEFADLLGSVLTKYDHILIIGDFNIHVCCSANALAKDFLNLLSSLNIVQWVNGPTHCHGHTLDLILSYGLSVADIEIRDTPLSDHKPLLFSTLLPLPPTTVPPHARWSRSLTPHSHVVFSEAENPLILDTPTSHLDVDEQLQAFNNKCSSILDSTSKAYPPSKKAPAMDN